MLLDAARWAYAHILAATWPNNGNATVRKRRLDRTLPDPKQGRELPCACVLVKQPEGGELAKVVGGGVLTDIGDYDCSRDRKSAQEFGLAALLLSVAIDESERGKGYGRRLVADLEASATTAGYGVLYLFTEIDTTPFYMQYGYERVDYDWLEDLQFIWMRKPLILVQQ